MLKVYLINRKELEKIKYNSGIITRERLEKTEKYKFKEDRELSVCAELLLVYALKTLDPEVELPLKITEDERGKPELESEIKGCPKMYFNISHSKDFAACAVSDNPVGIDIETVRVKEIGAPQKILHPREWQTMAFITNPDEKKNYFFECWVLKEAYLKQLGLGLAVRPSKFMVFEDEMVTEEKNLEKRYVHLYDSTEIKGSDWRLASGYRLAVCIMKKDDDSEARLLNAASFSSQPFLL